MAGKRIRLPFEDVRLSEAEIAITQTKAFQRLFDLRQLGLAYTVYPNATHTRGAHSIRCLGEAVKILEGLKHNNEAIAQADEECVRVTALLHDIGHLPFSHTLEDEHVVLQKHDGSPRLKRVLAQLKSELTSPRHVELIDRATPTLVAISKPEGPDADWRSDLVGNTICADLLAYITADAEATGIEKRPGHYRIYEYFQRHDNRLCIRLTKGGIRTDIISAIIDLLDMRFCLTERVIMHHAKCVASAMLARAARLARVSDADEELLTTLGDEGFLRYLGEKSVVRDDQEGLQRLLYCIRSRRLYQRVFKVGRQARDNWDASRRQNAFCEKWRDPAAVDELLRDLERTYRIPPGSVVLWCPEGKSGMKLVKAKVIYETTSGIQGPRALREIEEFGEHFRGVRDRVRTIEDVYRDLWSFWIAIDRQHIDRAPEIVETLEERLQIQCDLVFRDTYLNKLPGFNERRKQLVDVKKAAATLLPDVMESVAQQSALSGGKAGAEEGVVLEAMKAAIEKRQPTKSRKKKAERGDTSAVTDSAGLFAGEQDSTDRKSVV